MVGSESLRVISCDLEFDVTKDAAMVFQLAASVSAGLVIAEKLEIAGDSVDEATMREVAGPHGGRLHLLHEGADARQPRLDCYPGRPPQLARTLLALDLANSFFPAAVLRL